MVNETAMANIRRRDTEEVLVEVDADTLEGVRLERANLAGATLYAARYDADTRWPAGFNTQHQGALLVDRKAGVVPLFKVPRRGAARPVGTDEKGRVSYYVPGLSD